MTPCPKCGWNLDGKASCVMCGHAGEGISAEQTTDAPPENPKRRGPLARTVDVDSMKGIGQQLVGFVAVYANDKPAGVFWPLYSGETLFGRAGGGAPADIALNAPSVSARHARIFANTQTGVFTLHDQGSRNGTELNGEKLRPGEALPIEDNARIKIGLVELVVKLLP